MKKCENSEVIEGYLYQQNLQMKTVEREDSPNHGKEYITGTIDVATDEGMLNIITVRYSFVTELTKSGNKNATFTALKRIYDEGKTALIDGKDQAFKVKLSPAIALNDFYPQGKEPVVTVPRHEGGFVTILNRFDLPEGPRRQKFTVDMLVTRVKRVEADPEKHIEEEYAEISGAIFNFRNDLLPFKVIARTPDAIEYFEKLEASEKNPVFTQVWGQITNTVQTVTKVTESAFGEDAVDETQNRVKEWVVTGARTEPYLFNDSSTITAGELEKAVQQRNVYLAEKKKRDEDYFNSNNSTPQPVSDDFMPTPVPNAGPTPDMTIPAGGFNF